MYQQRDQEAITAFERAVILAPEIYLQWTDLGTAYRRVGRVSDCKRAYRRALTPGQS
jgi:Flp pilus assembly protein TadD